MTSQSGSQATTIHILPNISQSKGNQTMKFGQLIEYSNMKILECRKFHAENEAGRLVPDLFLFLKKASREAKAIGLQLNFIAF